MSPLLFGVYKMNLGELHNAFAPLHVDAFVFSAGFANPHSYRGYYDEVSFAPDTYVTLKDVKAAIRAACEDNFTGWKGGEYSYSWGTPVHLAFEGTTDGDDDRAMEELVAQMLEAYKLVNGETMVDVTPTKPKRKTAAEKRAEELVARETQRLREQEEALAAWPERLMKNLERASKQYWDVTIWNGRFVVAAKNSWGDLDEQRFGLTPVGRFEMWNQDNDWYAMDELERLLDRAEEEQREAERKAAVRQGAIAKLTKEEREELGL